MVDFYKDSAGNNKIPLIKVAEVVSVTDVTKSGRIKVRITGIDDTITNDSNLPLCAPLLPKYLLTLPKVGECVFIFQHEYSESSPTASFKSNRYWVGPLITQPDKLNEEPYNSALSILPDGYVKLKDPKLEKGTYGENEDIILQGRYNTDIIQKDRQIWLRAGKTVDGNPKKFNKELAYIQLKYGGEKLKRVVKERTVQTTTLPIPDRLIEVRMNTITNDNDILSGDLPKDTYRGSNINRTELFITVYDIKTGDVIIAYENETEFTGAQSRDNAFSEAEEFIKDNRGEKWKIKSLNNSCFDFISDVYKGKSGIAVFSSTPINGPTKIIKEIQLEKNDKKNGTVINVVANKINLLSNIRGANTFNLSDPKSLITDEEQEIINTKSHPLVYGDTLVDFLELVKKYVQLHVHPYHGLPPDMGTVTTKVLDFPLDTILNKNINSN